MKVPGGKKRTDNPATNTECLTTVRKHDKLRQTAPTRTETGFTVVFCIEVLTAAKNNDYVKNLTREETMDPQEYLKKVLKIKNPTSSGKTNTIDNKTYEQDTYEQ